MKVHQPRAHNLTIAALPVVITDAAIANVVNAAKKSATGRARVCLHRSWDDPVQEMLIAITKNSVLNPHRQRGLRKSYHLIKGALDITFWRKKNVRQGNLKLSLKPGAPRIISFDATAWHTCKSVSPVTVYIEVIAGPYSPARTEWLEPSADWT